MSIGFDFILRMRKPFNNISGGIKIKSRILLMALLLLTLMAISSTALAASEKPVADFYSPEINNQDNIRQIEPNALISFFDNSTGSPTSWLWDFGDGNISTEQNPTHVYGAMGGYTVNLTVKNAVGSNTTSKYGYALISLGDEPVGPAYFSSSATSGDAPFKVTFHEEAGGYLSSWTFGDGSQQNSILDDNSEILKDVEHTYLEPGQYTVTLYQGNFGGKNAITKYHYITVTGLTRPVASFTADKISVPKSLTIEFTDKSIGKPTSWSWNFGDGANSTEQNPMHTYSAAGNYTVNLTASNENGTDSKLATINVLKTTGPFAYITNVYDRNISVIDTATDNVVDTLDVGSSSVGVAVSLDGKKVYVTDGRKNVFVIDTTTSKVIATVHGLNSSQGIAITPDGTKAYVANWGNGSGSENGTVSVIDTATKTITNTVTVGILPHGVAVSPNGKKVYVTNYDDTISVIDTATNIVTDTLNIGQYPWGIAFNPEGTKVYVANYGNINDSPSHNVSVIDTATNTVTDRVKVGNGPYGVAVNPKGTKVYVTNYWENTTSVINTTTNTVTATVPVGNGPCGVSVTPDGKKVYVANQGSNYDLSDKTVSVIDAATNTVTATVKVGDGPTAFGQFIAPIPVPEQVLPVANFNNNVTEGYAPLTVQFTDLSKNATAWNWDFENDGIIDFTYKNSVHVYTVPGYYTVNLTAINANGTASKLSAIAVFNPADTVSPVANFSTNVTQGPAPLSVQFTDISKNTTLRNWNFGDGAISTEQNPMHTYSAAGNYTVNLTASNGKGTTSKTLNIIVEVAKVLPVADFISNTTSGYAPLSVQFSDLSQNLTSRNWDFGDGTNSTEQNPIHVYSAAGTYTVNLTVSNGNGTASKPAIMTVLQVTAPLTKTVEAAVEVVVVEVVAAVQVAPLNLQKMLKLKNFHRLSLQAGKL